MIGSRSKRGKSWRPILPLKLLSNHFFTQFPTSFGIFWIFSISCSPLYVHLAVFYIMTRMFNNVWREHCSQISCHPLRFRSKGDPHVASFLLSFWINQIYSLFFWRKSFTGVGKEEKWGGVDECRCQRIRLSRSTHLLESCSDQCPCPPLQDVSNRIECYDFEASWKDSEREGRLQSCFGHRQLKGKERREGKRKRKQVKSSVSSSFFLLNSSFALTSKGFVGDCFQELTPLGINFVQTVPWILVVDVADSMPKRRDYDYSRLVLWSIRFGLQ